MSELGHGRKHYVPPRRAIVRRINRGVSARRIEWAAPPHPPPRGLHSENSNIYIYVDARNARFFVTDKSNEEIFEGHTASNPPPPSSLPAFASPTETPSFTSTLETRGSSTRTINRTKSFLKGTPQPPPPPPMVLTVRIRSCRLLPLTLPGWSSSLGNP